jgi:hypothetical protein
MGAEAAPDFAGEPFARLPRRSRITLLRVSRVQDLVASARKT